LRLFQALFSIGQVAPRLVAVVVTPVISLLFLCCFSFAAKDFCSDLELHEQLIRL